MHVERLRLGVILHRMATEFASEAGLLVSPERQLRCAVHECVHPDGSRAYSTPDRQACIEILAPDAGREAVIDGVGDLDRFLSGVEGEDGKNGSEHLLARDRHPWRHLGENGRRHELTHTKIQRTTAMGDFGAGALCRRDVAGDLVEVLRRDDRADLCRRVEGIADLHMLGERRHARHDIAGDGLVQDQPRAGIAALAGIEIGAEHGRVDEGVEVRIREDDLRVLAAELQRDLLQCLRRIGHRQLTNAGRAGERNHVDVGMRRHDRADLGARAGHDIDDAIGNTGFLQDFTEHDRRARCQLRWLDHAGAARGQREGQLLADDQEREVPRRDDRDDTDRLAQHDTQCAVAERVVAFAMQIAGKGAA